VLVGGWYDVRVDTPTHLSLAFGLLSGVGFSSGLPQIKPASLVTYLDLAISQELDELVTVRGQLRPGMVGRYFSYQMNVNVCFRFL